jgi:hypothetical protein
MVGRSEHLIRAAYGKTALPQKLEGMVGAVMGDVTANVEQGLTVLPLAYRVGSPNLFV